MNIYVEHNGLAEFDLGCPMCALPLCVRKGAGIGGSYGTHEVTCPGCGGKFDVSIHDVVAYEAKLKDNAPDTSVDGTPIYIEDRVAGYALASVEHDDIYEILALHSWVCDSHDNLSILEMIMNVDKREGYRIHPLFDSGGNYVWHWKAKGLVTCVAIGMWG
jgi:hypothetical protein